MPSLAAEPGRFRPEACAHIAHDLLDPFQVPRGEYLEPVLQDENQMDVQDEDTVLARAHVAVFEHEIKYA